MIFTPFRPRKSGKNHDVPALLQEPAPTLLVSASSSRRNMPQPWWVPESPLVLYWALECDK